MEAACTSETLETCPHLSRVELTSNEGRKMKMIKSGKRSERRTVKEENDITKENENLEEYKN
jgi:hypothetical protein